MARVIAPPVFCIMKGAFAASKTPAFLAFTPIIPWPSMSAQHDLFLGLGPEAFVFDRLS